MDLVKTWRNRGLQQRQELAFSLYPDGLVFSRLVKDALPRMTDKLRSEPRYADLPRRMGLPQ